MKQNSLWFKRWLLGLASLFIGVGMLFAQEVSISGVVTSSEDGLPVPGVSVVQKGTSNGTITDFDGKYQLKVASGSVVVFSFIGMTTQEMSAGNSGVFNIVLASETTGLDEVVVTALGIKREKKALGYASTEIKGDQLVSNVINPVNALQGKVAGVEISQSDGGAFGSSKILIRGVSTLGKNNQPIYVVDGVILDNAVSNSGNADWNQAANDYGNELKNLNPDDFASVSVLKGAASTALYGSRGMNGAIVITTKSGTARKGMGVEVSQTFGLDYVYKQPDLQNEYGDGALSGYVDYGETNPDGTYKAYDNQRQFMLNSAGRHTVIGDWSGLGFGPRFDGSDIEYFDRSTRKYSPVKNNFKDTYDLGLSSTTNVALSGGNEHTTYYTSIGYLHSKGTLPNNEFQRLSLLTKASQDIGKYVNLEATLSFANSMPKNAQPNIGEYFIDGTFNRMYNPDALKKKYKGAHGGLANSSYGDAYGDNPGIGLWWSIYENDDSRKETSVRPGLILRAHLTEWLDFSTEGNYNYYYVKSESKNLGSGYANEGGSYSMSQYTKEQTNLNAAFTGNKTINDFSLTHLAGFYPKIIKKTCVFS